MGSGYFGGIYFAQYAPQFAVGGEVTPIEIIGTYEPLLTVAGVYESAQALPGTYEPTITIDGEWGD